MFVTRIEGGFRAGARRSGKIFNLKVVDQAEKKALAQAKKQALELYAKTVRTWRTPTEFTARDISKGVSIRTNNPKYRFIDLGTRVRHAIMSRNFVPKTKVGVVYSTQGQGGLKVVKKSIKRPGIRARGFTAKIEERIGPTLRRVFREELHTNWIVPD